MTNIVWKCLASNQSVRLLMFAMLLMTSMATSLCGQSLEATSSRGMVVSVSKAATEAGVAVLDRGGNAVDAAVAVGFALAVTWPEAGNIGGGGFMLVRPDSPGKAIVIDYREMAPAASTTEMFSGPQVSQYRLVGVPGTVRGFEAAHKKYGKLTWRSLLKPAIELARNGFEVDENLVRSLNHGLDEPDISDEFRRVYSADQRGRHWVVGDRLVQSDFADTLESIAEQGPDSFYRGSIAEKIVAEMNRGDGLISRADLENYRVHERAAVHGTFRGFDIYAAPLPSSGGTILIEMLNQIEGFDLRQMGRWSPETIHVMTECMRGAYLDRARYLGDPDFNVIPNHLISKEYAARLRSSIKMDSVTQSAELGQSILTPNESAQTTHFSVIDEAGMAVSNTYTLENDFGSRIVVRGGGFLLNNEMGDFNPRPGVTNDRGLIGTRPNLVAPGKRMLSSMCPVIVESRGNVILITGTPGGRTIINTMFCVLLNILEFQMPLREALDSPRMHHAWMPDLIRFEAALLSDHPEVISKLKELGHTIDLSPHLQGDAHSIWVDPSTQQRIGEADGRRGGHAAGQKESFR